jgi:tryptophan-rich sensory protein
MNIYFYILIPICLAVIINTFMYSNYSKNTNKELTTETSTNNSYLPPGYVIGIVWTILLGLMGYVYALLEKKSSKNKSYGLQKLAIIFLILFCLCYPIFTRNTSLRFSKNYNYATLLVVCIVYGIIYQVSFQIAYYLIPLLCWVFYVNLITLLDDLHIIQAFSSLDNE